MKKTKIIIPALGVLLLSTAASVTGTVAWFSMNKTVTATGMSVTAKSDSSFLLIGNEDDDLDTIQGANSISATAKNTTDELYPVAHETIGNTAAATTLSNWYYMYSDDPDDAMSGATEKLAIASGHFSDYVLQNVFNITVAAGGRAVTNLKVNTITITPASGGAPAVNVLVTSASAAQEFTASDSVATDNTVLSSTVTASAVVPVYVFIYWNGNNENVYTNNVDFLKQTTVELTFTYEGLVE